jgi:hypothetical protein
LLALAYPALQIPQPKTPARHAEARAKRSKVRQPNFS